MYLKRVEVAGFKSFANREIFNFDHPVTAIVGPNGSGKSNVAEAFRFVLGEQSVKSMRGKKTEDLIFNGSRKLPRMNRASVKIVFDNTKKFLDIDFDEVVIERVIHRDAQHFYYINGTQVRLKDISELLAKARIGCSGHHIVSQGEADRILHLNPRDKRALIEDALGLRIFQMRKAESERKLSKTSLNIDEAILLRRELGPHLNFLKRQVEKINQRKELQQELITKSQDYLKREATRVEFRHKQIRQELEEMQQDLSSRKSALGSSQVVPEQSSPEIKEHEEQLKVIESELNELSAKRQELSLDIARSETALDLTKRFFKETHNDGGTVPMKRIRGLRNELLSGVSENQVELSSQALQGWIGEKFEPILHDRSRQEKEKQEEQELSVERDSIREQLTILSGKRFEVDERIREKSQVVGKLKDTIIQFRRELSRLNEKHHVLKREVVSLELTIKNLEEDLIRVESRKSSFDQFLQEVAFVGGREVLQYPSFIIRNHKNEELPESTILNESESEQLKRRREIDRLAIKVEDMKVEGGEKLIQEYQATKERDEFLAKEIEDLKVTSKKLRGMVTDLEKTIEEEFKGGISSINDLFGEFFGAMFQGGSAKLEIVEMPGKKTEDDEETDSELGIEVSVDLPRKKVKSLEMLSGGERSLTSTALIFAMGQVNPPPFVILDETDAALDEANSDRYGEMIERLSAHSQLILITHNRNTMARAHALFGVTMGPSGASKLLSVDLEQAQSQAAR